MIATAQGDVVSGAGNCTTLRGDIVDIALGIERVNAGAATDDACGSDS